MITVRNEMSFWLLHDYGAKRAARIHVTRQEQSRHLTRPAALSILAPLSGINEHEVENGG